MSDMIDPDERDLAERTAAGCECRVNDSDAWVVWDYPTGQRLNIVDTQDKADYEITRYRGQGYDPTYEMVIVR